MRIKTVYIADNGKEFDNEKECREYEEKEKVIAKNAIKFARDIQDYCCTHNCDECIFFNKNHAEHCNLYSTPSEWDIDDLEF